MNTAPPAVRATLLIHQEAVVGLLAVIALAWTENGPLEALAPRQGLLLALAVGAAAGLVLALSLWLIRGLPALRVLQEWQREVVGRWTPTEAVAVALLSGLAEEALLRAVLQPVLGLWLAALLFAVLHVVPDRRLWFWPVMAMAMGVVFGLLFERHGFPACATGHGAVNLVGLLRLRDEG